MGFEDLSGESINQVLIFYQPDVMLFIKAASKLCSISSPAGGCRLLPNVEQRSAFCNCQNPSPCKRQKGMSGRYWVRCGPNRSSYVGYRELPRRNQTNGHGLADNLQAHITAAMAYVAHAARLCARYSYRQLLVAEIGWNPLISLPGK